MTIDQLIKILENYQSSIGGDSEIEVYEYCYEINRPIASIEVDLKEGKEIVIIK